MDMPQEMPQETPMEQMPDASQGYCIEICVLPDGTFNVSQEALPVEAAEDNADPNAEAGETLSSFGEALKAALDIYKQNPIVDSEQEQFDAGFGKKQMPGAKRGGPLL